MRLNEYQDAALANERKRDFVADRLTASIIGLTKHVGKLASPLQAFLVDKQLVDREVIVKSLGAVLWYVAQAADAVGVTLEDVATANLNELTIDKRWRRRA